MALDSVSSSLNIIFISNFIVDMANAQSWSVTPGVCRCCGWRFDGASLDDGFLDAKVVKQDGEQ